PVNPFLVNLGQVVYYGVVIYVWIIIARVLLTWVNPNPYSPLMRFLSSLTDPLLNRGRRLVPFTFGGLDFSPIVVIILIQLAGTVLGVSLMSIGQGAPLSVVAPVVGLALISLLDSIATILIILMALRLIMALVNPSPYNIIVQIVYGLTEPLLAPLRRLFPAGPGGFDTRALIFLAVTVLVKWVVLGSLSGATAKWMNTIITNV
ncbi:YggT family protein, partial [Deltaproteobacteria bacterium OttesenSCG-928-M10]|nr:YggT family protein [Deltaproteobacteria bacterium OttesenSCG-928-M10]